MPEIISSAAATAAIKKVAESAAQDVYSQTKSIALGAIDKLRVQFGIGFSKYIARVYDKCRFVKTILHRIDPVPIDKAYIQPTLYLRKRDVSGGHFIPELDVLKNIVVVGVGGSGKSMFLKYTFLDLCANTFGRIPIFIELRDLNDTSSSNLVDLIFSQWSALIPGFIIPQLDYALRTGKFTILLDALDEVDHERRERVSKDIIQMSFMYPECRFLVTSRPDDRFSSWTEFYTAEIKPLTRAQISELVTKIEFDTAIKRKFLSEVDTRLLASHKEFLSNPLLCTIMLITYNEFEEIPPKMHIFYQRAFDVLFSRHDKTKPSFRRKFYTNLAEDDFSKLFSSFCFVSYLEKKYSFDKPAAMKFIAAAKKIDKINVDSENFLKDLSESVSILLQEGETYSFLHRSFQEYFTAHFLADRQLPRMDELFLPVVGRHDTDSVIELLVEMKREVFEIKYLAPLVRRQIGEIAERGGVEKHPTAIASLYLVRFTGDARGLHSLTWDHRSLALEMIDAVYFKSKAFRMLGEPSDELWSEIISSCVQLAREGKLKKGVTKLKDGEYSVGMEMAEVPDSVIKRSRLYDRLVEVSRDLEKLNNKLTQNMASKTDVVEDLLKGIEL